MRALLISLLLATSAAAQLTVDVQPVSGSQFARGCPSSSGPRLLVEAFFVSGVVPQELWARLGVGLEFAPYDVLYVVAPPQPATPVIDLGPGWPPTFDWYGIGDYASIVSNRRVVLRIPNVQPFSVYIQAVPFLPAAPQIGCTRPFVNITRAVELSVR